MNIKEQVIKSVDTIKNKIKMIQNEEDESNLKFKKVFKPIIKPLETLIKVKSSKYPDGGTSNSMEESGMNDELNSSMEYDDFKDLFNVHSYKDTERSSDDEYKSPLKTNNDTLISLKKEDLMDIYDGINIPFGIRSENKKLMMGNSEVSLSQSKNATSGKSYVMTLNDMKYNLTPGLTELLIRNKPDLKVVTDKDKMIYKDMLDITNAHKRDYNPSGQIKGDKGIKYCKIIKPLFSQNTHLTKPQNNLSSKIGGNLPILKKYNKNTDYIYWDDPNELIERLKLLIASKSAGNSNHDNEIISIIEELQEAGIIEK